MAQSHRRSSRQRKPKSDPEFTFLTSQGIAEELERQLENTHSQRRLSDNNDAIDHELTEFQQLEQKNQLPEAVKTKLALELEILKL